MHAIHQLASRRATRFVSMSSFSDEDSTCRPDVSLRRMLYEYVIRADKCGTIKTLATEERLSRIVNVPMRMYTGVSSFDGMPDGITEVFCDSVKKMSIYAATKGTICEPRCIRGVLRGTGVTVDQTKAHMFAQLARHPLSVKLKEYLQNSSDIHTQILPDDPDRDDKCKPMFRALMRGGGQPLLNKFRSENKVGDLSFIFMFKKEHEDIRRADVLANPEVLEKLMQSGYDRYHAEVCVGVVLDEWYERAVGEKVEAAITDLGKVAGLDHDGRHVQSSTGDMDEDWEREVLAVANSIAPHKIDTLPDLAEAITILTGRFPEHDWTTVDASWEENEAACMEVNERLRLGQSHFGELAARAVVKYIIRVGDRFMTVDDVHKFVPGSKDPDFMYYDAVEQIWITDAGNTGARALERTVSDCLQSCLGSYEGLLPEAVYNPAVLRSIVGAMEARMFDLSFYFKLDGDHTRSLVCYTHGLVEERDSKTFMQMRPEDCASRCTGYPFPAKEIEALQEKLRARGVDLLDTLNKVKTEEVFMGVSNGRFVELLPKSKYNPEPVRQLDIIADIVPGLRDLANCHDNWSLTIFLFKQFARARYARERFEEIMFWLGETGQNGKGLWYAVMKIVFGSYAHEPKPELFTQLPPAEGPTPFILNCRGRRLLLVPELEQDSEVLVGLLKRLRDQSASIEGRGLFRGAVEFQPQHLQIFSANVKPKLSGYDGGVQRSFTGVQWPFHFCESPDASQMQKLLNSELKKKSALMTLIPGMDMLLRAFDTVFTSQSTATVVSPRPADVATASSKLLDSIGNTIVAEFINQRFGKATWDVASTRPQVTKFLMNEFKDQFGGGKKGSEAAAAALRLHLTEVRVNGRDLLQWIGTFEYAIIKPAV